MNKIFRYINISKLFVLLNYLAIFIGLLNTYFRPKFFEQFFSESNFAFLTLVYGLVVYLGFLDGGISKPLYAELREDFVANQKDYKLLIQQSFSFYNIVLSIALIIFFTVLCVLSFNLKNTLTITLLFLIASNLVLNFQLQNLKNILIAVNQYEFFQKIEVLRRFSNLIAIISLFIDKSFILGNSIANVILILLLVVIYKNQNITVRSLNFSEGLSFYKSFFKRAKNFFLFTVNEILIYNSGFLLIPVFYKEIDIIMFGLLITVYNGVAIFSRSVIDMSIHEMTKKYLENQKKESWKIFKYSILFSSLFTVLLFGVIYLFSNPIFKMWVGEKYEFNTLMFLGLFTFLIGNVIQHTAGTFLLSIKNNYSIMMKISSRILFLMLTLQIIVCILKESLEIFFLTTSILYLAGAFFYLFKAKSFYKN